MSIVTIVDDNNKQYVYQVDSSLPPLGAGGMGKVYRGWRVNASNPADRREVAVKFMHENLDDNVIERARRESSVRIVDPNVLEMIDFVTMTYQSPQGLKRRYFVVSELLNGVSLLNLVKGVTTDPSGKDFPFAKMLFQRFKLDRPAFVNTIVTGVLKGLAAMHGAGYIHRDIDPSNVMITVDGKIKIIDFGIAKNIDPNAKTDVSLTSAGSGMGKAVYSSPEVLSGDLAKQNPSSDLYSVGIMIYGLTVGTLPYSGTLTDILVSKMKQPVPVENIPDANLRHVVKRATALDQRHRFSNAAEFKTALDRESGGNSGLIIGLIIGAAVILLGLISWLIIALL